MKANRRRAVAIDIACELIGCLLSAIGLYNFAVMAEFPMIGFSGIAIILHRLFGLPIGLTTIGLNIPVILLCWRLLGKRFLGNSIFCMLLSSLFVDYVAPLFPVYTGSRMLAALCTGVIAGIGYALIYMRNSSAGGSDFIVMAVKAVRPYLSLGSIVFVSDVLIVLAAGMLFRDVDGIIYGMIISFIYAVVLDKMLYGLNAGKMALIVTDKGKEIADVIDASTGRGSTLLQAAGGYKQEKKQVVLCVCSTKQMFFVQQAVKEADPASFVIILESREVHGNGFHMVQVGQTKKQG